MSDKNNFSPEVKQKFDSLPPFVQETLMQSGAKFNSLNELEEMANDILSSHNEK